MAVVDPCEELSAAALSCWLSHDHCSNELLPGWVLVLHGAPHVLTDRYPLSCPLMYCGVVAFCWDLANVMYNSFWWVKLAILLQKMLYSLRSGRMVCPSEGFPGYPLDRYMPLDLRLMQKVLSFQVDNIRIRQALNWGNWDGSAKATIRHHKSELFHWSDTTCGPRSKAWTLSNFSVDFATRSFTWRCWMAEATEPNV